MAANVTATVTKEVIRLSWDCEHHFPVSDGYVWKSQKFPDGKSIEPCMDGTLQTRDEI
jgi:hypothetical protein